MIIKIFVFVLFSVTAVQVHAQENFLDFGDNGVSQVCTKEDLLHAQGKSPCLLKLKSSRALIEEMGKQYAAYYNELRSQKLDAELLQTLEQNHTDYKNHLLELLKEYRIDIEQLQATLNSNKRKALCKKFIPSIEKKHAYLNALGKHIQTQVANAAHRSIQARPSQSWLSKTWDKIEKPLYVVIGIGMLCDLSWKIGKKLYTWGKMGYNWATATEEGLLSQDSLAAQQADIQQFTSTIDELTLGEEVDTDSRQLLVDLAEAFEPTTELAETADRAVFNEATSVMDAFVARQTAMRAADTPEAAELLASARAAEVARVASSAEAIEAAQASEIAQVVQVARIAEAAEGIGQAAIEGAEEAAVEGAVEGAEVAAAEGAEVAVAEGAGEVVGEVTAESLLLAIGEGAAVEGTAIGTAVAAPVAVPVAIAAVGAVVVGAAVSGIAYVIDPEGTKRFYRNLWNSIRHVFHYN